MLRLVLLLPLCLSVQCALRVPAEPSYAGEMRLNRKALDDLLKFTEFTKPSNGNSVEDLNRKYLSFFGQTLLEKLVRPQNNGQSNDSREYEEVYTETFAELLQNLNNDNLDRVVGRALRNVNDFRQAFGKLFFYENKYCSQGEPRSTCEHQLRGAFRAERAQCQYFKNVLKLSDLSARFSKELNRFLPKFENAVRENRVLAFLHKEKTNLKKFYLTSSNAYNYRLGHKLKCLY